MVEKKEQSNTLESNQRFSQDKKKIDYIADVPSIETPLDEHATYSKLPPNIPIPPRRLKDRRAPTSQSRAMIVAATSILMLSGLVQAYYSSNPQDVMLLLAVSIAIWLGVAWKIRSLPINRKTRQLDQSLLRAREKAEQDNVAKTRFLAIASHEMRTPLNGILGMSKLLGSTSLTPEQKSYNNAVQKSGLAMFALVENMLDITAIELGQSKLNQISIGLRKEIEDIGEVLAPRAHEKGLDLAIYVEPDLPDDLKLDIQKTRQIINNLISNAIKFTQTGGILLEARVEKQTARNPNLCIFVSDTGPGIGETDKQRIFNEFEQVEPIKPANHSGVGLGLAISRSFAATMGGTLTLSDRKGGGSQFCFKIPLNIQNNKNLSTPITQKNDALAGRKILIVSEKLFTPLCLKWILEAEGASVEIATEPVNPARHDLYDKILFDQDFVNSSAELASENERPLTKYIAMQEPGNRKYLPELVKMGFDHYLILPARRKTLLDILNNDFLPENANPQLQSDTPIVPLRETQNNNIHVLLAEDNPVNALLVQSVLAKNNIHVDTAENGEIAVEMFKKNSRTSQSYDLIYMDLHMPRMDGLNAAKQIRNHERSRKLSRTPIVILSADVQENIAGIIIEVGADEYLSKPVDPDDLIGNLKKYITA